MKYYIPAVGFGGPIQCAHNVAKHLTRRGHEVTVYASDVFSPKSNLRVPYSTRVVDGVSVRYFANVGEVSEMYISPGIVPALRHSLGEFDVVHLHEYRSFQNVAFSMLNNRKLRYVLQTHGIKQSESATAEGKPLHVAARKAYDQVFGKRLMKNANKLIALTESERGLLIRGGGAAEKIVVMPNGVSPEDFENPSPKNFLGKYGLDGSRVVLYVGRLNRTKGVDTLVKAFYLLQMGGDDLRLVIAGPDDGILMDLKDLVKNFRMEKRVVFTGLLDHEQVRDAYAAADVVVYPGRYEGFPIVPLEAGINGKPLVVSNDPGMDYVRKGGFGLSFRYGDEHALKQTVARILFDGELGRELGEAGKKCVLENYTWDKIATSVEDLYRGILS